MVAGSRPVWHLYVIRTADPEALGGYLASRGIATGRHYPQPIHLSPAYRHLGHTEGEFPVAEQLAAVSLSLPMFPELTEAEVEVVAGGVRDYFAGG